MWISGKMCANGDKCLVRKSHGLGFILRAFMREEIALRPIQHPFHSKRISVTPPIVLSINLTIAIDHRKDWSQVRGFFPTTKPWSVHNLLWQFVPERDFSNAERMFAAKYLTPLLVNLEIMTTKPKTDGGSKHCVTWKVEKAVHHFVRIGKVTTESSTD